jgi:NAD(P)-dependent dehydrogenase (short-subunit alcohol dehydrogenase family)
MGRHESKAMNGIEGRGALVTGAAGDIGRAVAVRLASAGALIALADHGSAHGRLLETREACLKPGTSPRVEMIEFDVSDEHEVAGALDQVAATIGISSLVFNNAGVQGEFIPVQNYPVSDARRVFEVNVIGALNVLSAASRRMIEHGSEGSVVNSASMAGVAGAPNMSAYSASKAAVIGLTLSAAKDLAPHGIRVNAISPAFIGPGRMWTRQVEAQAMVGSPYYSTDPDEVAAQMIGQVPMRRFGTLDEVASSVTFLLSDDASYLTGVNLEIAGGAR